jgi:hypothetical protein
MNHWLKGPVPIPDLNKNKQQNPNQSFQIYDPDPFESLEVPAIECC